MGEPVKVEVKQKMLLATAAAAISNVMSAGDAAPSTHFSQHTSIFSIRAFSAPPTDGQLLVTF